MNIFILDTDPTQAAKYLCDKHVVKMAVESAQMMASALRRHGATDIDMPLTVAGKPYRGGYPNHPCTRWAGETCANFEWLGINGLAICDEFNRRYKKHHACKHAMVHMMKFVNYLPDAPQTRFALAMPDEFKHKNAVKAYRKYYVGDKAAIAKWNRGRPAPRWFSNMRKS